MKVLLFQNLSDMQFLPPKMQKLLSQSSFPFNRFGAIINYIEQNSINFTSIPTTVNEWCLLNPNQILRYTESCYLISILNQFKQFTIFKIIDVDIDRPWTIEDQDGDETIKYLDYKDYEIVDQNTNFYKLINN